MSVFLRRCGKLEDENLEFELPNLERCTLCIDCNNEEKWLRLLNDGNKDKFELYSYDDKSGNIYNDF